MILMYHKVFPESPTVWWVTVDNFYRQMADLQNKKVVYLDEYNPNNNNQVVITFDGVYENVLYYAAPILKKYSYPFELFITGDYIGKNNSFDVIEPNTNFATIDNLKSLVKIGGRLQWHSKTHCDIQQCSNREEIIKELEIPNELNRLDPSGFKWFAYPHGNLNENYINEVKQRFNGAVSCTQGNDYNIYRLNRIAVLNQSSFKENSIAVIIASYNYGHFLIEAIESVLRQTILADEILITDDCSDDNTTEIALDYVNKYPGFIKFNRNEINLGIVKNFSKAISLTKSDYICILGADNRLLSNYLEETYKILNDSPDIAIAYTDFALFGPRAKLTFEKFPDNFKGNVKENYYYIINFPQFNEKSKRQLEHGNFIHGSSMFRRKAYEDVGGYIEKENVPEDANLFLRMIKKGWIAKKTGNTLLEYRQHSRDQASIRLGTSSEVMFYKRKFKEVLIEYEKLNNSFSWKITKPLRMAKQIFFLTNKALSILRNEGFKNLLNRSKKYLKRIYL